MTSDRALVSSSGPLAGGRAVNVRHEHRLVVAQHADAVAVAHGIVAELAAQKVGHQPFREVSPGVEDIRVTGLMALYQQNQRAEPLGAGRGGIFFPDMAGLGGTARRMVWTDLDQWHWENLVV